MISIITHLGSCLQYISSFFKKNYLFIYFWLCWIFVSVQGLSLVAVSGGHSSLQCTGRSLSWPLPLRSTGSRRADSVVVAHGPSCSVACGIFPDQGSNPCPLHWQADSQPLRHQGSPTIYFLMKKASPRTWTCSEQNSATFNPKKLSRTIMVKLKIRDLEIF